MSSVYSAQDTGFICGVLPALNPSYGLRTGTQVEAGRVATGPLFSASLASLVVKEVLFFAKGGTVSLPQIQDRKAATCLKARC